MTETREQYIIDTIPVQIVEPGSATDLAPIALDLVVKWSEADEMRTNAVDQNDWVNAYTQQRIVEQSMRGLANQYAALQLAEQMEYEHERDEALPVEPVTRGRNRLFKEQAGSNPLS